MDYVLIKDEISHESLCKALSIVYDITIHGENPEIILDNGIYLVLNEADSHIQIWARTPLACSTPNALAVKVANQLNKDYAVVKTLYVRETDKSAAYFYLCSVLYDSKLDIFLLLKTLRVFNNLLYTFVEKIKKSGIIFDEKFLK